MAQSPRKRREAAARRSRRVRGKPDAHRAARAGPDAVSHEPTRAAADVDDDTLRDRLRREYDDAVRRLRQLGAGAEAGEAERRELGGPVVEEGDTAQANEQTEMSFATRERLTERVNRLAAALQRVAADTYGTCSVCGQPIERARLAAMPEAATCLRCQQEAERPGRQRVA
jgi:DnaK suppressor protein